MIKDKLDELNAYKRAIRLCQRRSGATVKEISEVLNKGKDSVTALRTHLKRSYPTLIVTSQLLTVEEKKALKLKNGPHKRYFISSKASEGNANASVSASEQGPQLVPEKPESEVPAEVETKAQTSQVEPSNVAPSQTGQEGIVGVGKSEEAAPGTDQQAAEQVKSPNPEEPSPQVPAQVPEPSPEDKQ